MMRPNLAQDAPPTEITVGGVVYSIDTDYMAWIEVLCMMRDIVTMPTTPEHARKNTEIFVQIEEKIFGRVIPHPVNEVLDAVREFANGYPEAPVSASERQRAQTYSFEWDLNYIILAIRNQSGIDISYNRKEPFHWWLFLMEFRSLCGDHYILRLMEIRGYDGKDPEMKKQAQRYALPRETTGDDRAILEDFDALFYNS